MMRSIKVESCFLSAAIVSIAIGTGGVSEARAQAADGKDPALERFYTGNALFNRKVYTAAIPEYKEFLSAYPQHEKAEQVRLALALSYYLNGSYAEAEPSLRTVIQNGKIGDMAQLKLFLGQSLLKLRGPAPEAEKILAEAAQAPGAAEYKNLAAALLTDTYFKQKKWVETSAAADAAMKVLKPGDLATRSAYQGAYALYNLTNFNAAAKILETLVPQVTNTPLEGQIGFLLGESRRGAGDLEKAGQAYLAVSKKANDPFQVEALFRLGSVCFFQNKFDEAIDALARALQARPSGEFSDEARLQVGRSYLEKKQYDPARQYLVQVLQGTNAFSAEAGLWIGRSFSRQDRPAEAVAALGEYLKRFHRDRLLADLLFEHANANMAQKKYGEAAESFGRIAGECPKWPDLLEAIRLRALCLHWEKKYHESLQLCDRYIGGASNNPDTGILFLKAENTYFLNMKNADGALKLYQEFVAGHASDPKADAAALRMAQILHGKGDWTNALAAVTPLVKKSPTGKAFSQVHFIAGDSHFRMESWEGAITNLNVFIAKTGGDEPNRDTAMMELALAEGRKNKTDTVAKNLATLVTGHAKSAHLPMALAEQGRLLYEQKNLGEARNALQKILMDFPSSPQRTPAEYYLGWIALDEKKDLEAEGHFEYVVSKNPGDPLAQDSLLQLGLLKLKTEKYAEAVKHLSHHTRVYTNSPKADEAMYSAGVAMAKSKQWDGAAGCFAQLAERFPKSPLLDRGFYEWAWAERSRNQISNAVKRYEALLQACPQSSLTERARFELSELTFDAKDFDKVIKQLIESVATAKEKTVKEQAMYRLAWAYHQKGDAESAAKEFEAVVKEFPQGDQAASAYYQAGECRLKIKEFELARDHFAAAVKARNAKEVHESALLRLGEMQGLMQQWKESAATYEEFQRTYPSSQYIQRARFGAGWAYEKQKLYPQAIAEYRKATANKAADETAARSQFQIGECLFAQGRHQEAIQELMRVDVNYRFKEWSAKAFLEIGRALEAKGDKTAAVAQFKEVVAKFADNDAALVAKERLNALRSSM